jgi:hypothetical protein
MREATQDEGKRNIFCPFFFWNLFQRKIFIAAAASSFSLVLDYSKAVL